MCHTADQPNPTQPVSQKSRVRTHSSEPSDQKGQKWHRVHQAAPLTTLGGVCTDSQPQQLVPHLR